MEVVDRYSDPQLRVMFRHHRIVISGIEEIHETLNHFDEYDIYGDATAINVLNVNGLNIEQFRSVIQSVSFINCVFVDDIPIVLPEGIRELTFTNCVNVVINNVPESVLYFTISECGLTELPELPQNLEILTCNNNQIQHLPILPDTLSVLNADNNCLVSLPLMPLGMTRISVMYNQIDYAPDNITDCESLTEFVRDYDRVILTAEQRSFLDIIEDEFYFGGEGGEDDEDYVVNDGEVMY